MARVLRRKRKNKGKGKVTAKTRLSIGRAGNTFITREGETGEMNNKDKEGSEVGGGSKEGREGRGDFKTQKRPVLRELTNVSASQQVKSGDKGKGKEIAERKEGVVVPGGNRDKEVRLEEKKGAITRREGRGWKREARGLKSASWTTEGGNQSPSWNEERVLKKGKRKLGTGTERREDSKRARSVQNDDTKMVEAVEQPRREQ